jgi:carbon monoxide dehydrogenase subunit G
MTKFKLSIHINQPPDIVVQALMDPENAVHWTTDLEKFEVVKLEPGKVGSVAHLHYLQKGRSYIMKDELIFSDPGKRYVSRVSGGGLSARVETLINPKNNGTEMSLSWSGAGDSFLVKLLLPFLRGKIIKGAKADLEKFKSLVETHGTHFGGK